MRMNLKTQARRMLVGITFGPLALAVALAAPASPAADHAAAAAPDLTTANDVTGTGSRTTAADITRKSASDKADATPSASPGAAQAVPDVSTLANTSLGGGGTSANTESVSAAYKDLVKSAGAQETYQNLSADIGLDKARQVLDAGSDDDIAAARKARAAVDSNASQRTSGLPRTEEQMRQDEARASLLATQLLDEVAPWVGGAVLLYVSVKMGRYFLLRSREKAARRRRRRRSGVRTY
jgi:hypothetical protein